MAKTSLSPKPYLAIRPGATPLRRYAEDVWHHRYMVRVLALRDVKLRYRQTALGVVWVVLQPLLAAAAVAFVFGRIAKLPTDGVSYFAFAYSGMLGWQAFNTTANKATTSLVGNSGLVSKVFFPRILLPFSAFAAAFLDTAVGLLVLPFLVLGEGVSVGPAVLLAPLWLSLVLMCSLGVGFILSSVSVIYRDVLQVSTLVLQLFFYITPVAYSVSVVPERFKTLYYLNPLTGLFEGFRWSLVGTPAPTPGHVAYSVLVAFALFVGGAVFLERMEPKFADVI